MIIHHLRVRSFLGIQKGFLNVSISGRKSAQKPNGLLRDTSLGPSMFTEEDELLDSRETLIFSSLYLDSVARNSEQPKATLLAVGFRRLHCQNWTASRILVRFQGRNSLLSEPVEGRLYHWVYKGKGHCDLECKWDPFMLAAPVPEKIPSSGLQLVTLSTRKDTLGSEFRDIVHVVRNANSPKHKLGVCVTPSYLYGDWLLTIQFLEAWRALGASQFWLYETSITKQVDRWLSIYESEGLVQRIRWPLLPTTAKNDPNREVFRMGEFAAQTDCIRRTIGHVKFLALVDFDEYLLPRKRESTEAMSLIDFLEELTNRYPLAGSFHFQQPGKFLYPNNFSFPQKVDLRRLNFNYMADVQVKDEQKMSHNKSVIRPDRIWEIRNHRVRRFVRSEFSQVLVARSEARLVHLRRERGNSAESALTVTVVTEFRRFISEMNRHFNGVVRRNFGDAPETAMILDSDSEVLDTVQEKCGLNRKAFKALMPCKAVHYICPEVLQKKSFHWIVHNGTKTSRFVPI